MGMSGPSAAIKMIAYEQHFSSFADVVIGVTLLFYLMISKPFRTDQNLLLGQPPIGRW
jgi:hypothetical protein